MFGVDMSLSTNTDDREKDILILGKDPTHRLEYTLSAEKIYLINFTEHKKKFCLSFQYNRGNICLLMAKKFTNSK